MTAHNGGKREVHAKETRRRAKPGELGAQLGKKKKKVSDHGEEKWGGGGAWEQDALVKSGCRGDEWFKWCKMVFCHLLASRGVSRTRGDGWGTDERRNRQKNTNWLSGRYEQRDGAARSKWRI